MELVTLLTFITSSCLVIQTKALIQASNENFTIISFEYNSKFQAWSWEFAANYCSSYISTNLASIHSDDEQTSLIQLRNDSNLETAQCWIGLYVNTTKYPDLTRINNYNDSNFDWIDGTTFNYKNWEPDEPSNETNEFCTQVWSGISTSKCDGCWNNIECDVLNVNDVFVCNTPDLSRTLPTNPSLRIYNITISLNSHTHSNSEGTFYFRLVSNSINSKQIWTDWFEFNLFIEKNATYSLYPTFRDLGVANISNIHSLIILTNHFDRIIIDNVSINSNNDLTLSLDSLPLYYNTLNESITVDDGCSYVTINFVDKYYNLTNSGLSSCDFNDLESLAPTTTPSSAPTLIPTAAPSYAPTGPTLVPTMDSGGGGGGNNIENSMETTKDNGGKKDNGNGSGILSDGGLLTTLLIIACLCAVILLLLGIFALYMRCVDDTPSKVSLKANSMTASNSRNLSNNKFKNNKNKKKGSNNNTTDNREDSEDMYSNKDNYVTKNGNSKTNGNDKNNKNNNKTKGRNESNATSRSGRTSTNTTRKSTKGRTKTNGTDGGGGGDGDGNQSDTESILLSGRSFFRNNSNDPGANINENNQQDSNRLSVIDIENVPGLSGGVLGGRSYGQSLSEADAQSEGQPKVSRNLSRHTSQGSTILDVLNDTGDEREDGEENDGTEIVTRNDTGDL